MNRSFMWDIFVVATLFRLVELKGLGLGLKAQKGPNSLRMRGFIV
jgi:hypothetical protein